MKVQIFSECVKDGKTPEILFWVGCSGSFDERAKKITKAFVKILNDAKIDFAVLGNEESCSGDPAKRSGNEFLFQMQALGNIEVLNSYNVKKIVTACPHCFNTIKNEYPALGGNYEVVHHSQLLNEFIKEGKIISQKINKKISYHDSCYLGRGNNIYEAPREIINSITDNIKELKRNKKNGLCCGAGGSQIFKESESGKVEINIERVKDIEKVKPDTVVSACPFCMTMLTDGVTQRNLDNDIKVIDIAELVEKNLKN